jgi:hypothetical protein
MAWILFLNDRWHKVSRPVAAGVVQSPVSKWRQLGLMPV